MVARTSPSASISGLRFGILLYLSVIGFAETDDAATPLRRHKKKQNKTITKRAQSDAKRLTIVTSLIYLNVSGPGIKPPTQPKNIAPARICPALLWGGKMIHKHIQSAHKSWREISCARRVFGGVSHCGGTAGGGGHPITITQAHNREYSQHIPKQQKPGKAGNQAQSPAKTNPALPGKKNPKEFKKVPQPQKPPPMLCAASAFLRSGDDQ